MPRSGRSGFLLVGWLLTAIGTLAIIILVAIGAARGLLLVLSIVVLFGVVLSALDILIRMVSLRRGESRADGNNTNAQDPTRAGETDRKRVSEITISTTDGTAERPEKRVRDQPNSGAEARHQLATREVPELAALHTVDGSHHPALAAAFVQFGALGAWGASRRGRRHIASGAPREDAFALRATDQGIVIVVADGVGSTPDAHLAATAAAAACAAYPWQEARSRPEWEDTVNRALIAIQAAVAQRVPLTRAGVRSPRPSTTLVAGLVIPQGPRGIVFWCSVGDSAISRLQRRDGGRLHIVNRAPTSSDPVTSALPSTSPSVETGVFDIDFQQDFLLLTTDGCSKPIRQNPELYIRDFNSIVENENDASFLLAAIQQKGAGFDDDATTVLVSLAGL